MNTLHSDVALRLSANAHNNIIAAAACDEACLGKIVKTPSETGSKSSLITHPQNLFNKISDEPTLQSDAAVRGSAIAQKPNTAAADCDVTIQRFAHNKRLSTQTATKNFQHPLSSDEPALQSDAAVGGSAIAQKPNTAAADCDAVNRSFTHKNLKMNMAWA